MKKLIIISLLFLLIPSISFAGINLIDQIVPKNDGFQGLVDDDQIIDTETTAGNILVSDGDYFDSTAPTTDLTVDLCTQAECDAQDACSEITDCVPNAWDADGDISEDEISESKVNFSTACAAGNHYYLSGNDLACEADDDTTYTADDGLALTGTEFDIDLCSGSDGDSSEVDTDSGLEIVGNQLTLLRGCSDNQILKWDETEDDWNCEADDAGGGSGSVTTMKEATSQVGGADIVTLDFGAGFDLSEDPDTEINITLDLTEISVDANTGDSATDFFDAGEIVDARISDTLTCSTCTGNAATVTTNANLTGEVTSVGNAATIADTITVTGWTMGASTATTPAENDNDTSLATTAYVQTEIGTFISATLTEEEVEDYIGGMITGNTETGIAVTYEDDDGTLDFVVSESDPTVDTDDEIIAIINVSPSTQIKHEAGGLEADVSAYNGFVYITGGTTSAKTQNAGTDVTADLEEETHASEHLADAADEIFGENLGTACTIGQVWASDGDGTVSCANAPIFKAKLAFEDPVAGDDFFFEELANNATAVSIYCKTLVGTVDLDVTIGGSDINGTDITCTTDGVLDDSLGGDTDLNVGEELKLEITSVASVPTYLFVQVNGVYDDQTNQTTLYHINSIIHNGAGIVF